MPHEIINMIFGNILYLNHLSMDSGINNTHDSFATNISQEVKITHYTNYEKSLEYMMLQWRYS